MSTDYYGSKTNWGIGVVEDINDPTQSGRVRVRVYGLHTVNMESLPITDLPWSQVMMPVTSASISGIGTSPIGLKIGSLVYGVYLDPDMKQQFLVLGSLSGPKNTSQAQRTDPSIEEAINEMEIDDFGTSTPEAIFKLARAKGLTNIQAAGLVGAVADVNELSFDSEDFNGEALGIGKFERDDVELLRKYANERNKTVSDLKTQIEFICDRLLGNYSPKKATGVLNIIGEDYSSVVTTDIDNEKDAANAIAQLFFRRGNSTRPQRERYAQQAMAEYGKVVGDSAGQFLSRQPPNVLRNGEIGKIFETKEELTTYFEEGRDARISGSNRIRGLIIHHADTYENMNTDAAEIDRWHKQSGFSEIGYHFVLLRNGGISLGRDIKKTGAHTSAKDSSGRGFNNFTIGISFIGGKVGSSAQGGNQRSASTFTTAQWNAFDLFISAWLQVFPDSFVRGHADVQPGNRSDPEFDVVSYISNKYPQWTGNGEELQPSRRRT